MTDRIDYTRYFDALLTTAPEPPPAGYEKRTHEDAPDNRSFYLVSDPIEQAVNVALATGRPLFVKGEPGCGKTALARHVARFFDWGYERVTVKSDTTVQELAWTFDGVQRLNDAMVDRLRSKSTDSGENNSTLEPYFEPGPIWRAFALESPRISGKAEAPERVVLLLDEIDKADPDVPNGLLDTLGNMQFRVPELKRWIKAEVLPFVVLTSNDERELPGAFLRRCVILELEAPTAPWLTRIAHNHFATLDQALLERLLPAFVDLRRQAADRGLRKPSTAEFLDALEAAHTMKVGPDHPLWDAVLRLTLWKHPAAT